MKRIATVTAFALAVQPVLAETVCEPLTEDLSICSDDEFGPTAQEDGRTGVRVEVDEILAWTTFFAGPPLRTPSDLDEEMALNASLVLARGTTRFGTALPGLSRFDQALTHAYFAWNDEWGWEFVIVVHIAVVDGVPVTIQFMQRNTEGVEQRLADFVAAAEALLSRPDGTPILAVLDTPEGRTE